MNEFNEMTKDIKDNVNFFEAEEPTDNTEEPIEGAGSFTLTIKVDDVEFSTESYELLGDAKSEAINQFNLLLETTDNFDAIITSGGIEDAKAWEWRLRSLDMDEYSKWIDETPPTDKNGVEEEPIEDLEAEEPIMDEIEKEEEDER